ncbi:N-acetylneuraminate lyase [Caulifigura coniformis]|uniref:N-acetylneuraminate lyase n=1 Tax=Caulifigura coniformis TaxID=2527983 RepID=A0A517SBA4_9PLAN|nr:dihydrodipicolinate synthase family protein [Caulifigura coniformis]QDT53392.1 N-acetylneuraminate lyase [Caulifigura coniformis]
MPAFAKLSGLVAATHTPFGPDGSLNLGVVEKQAEHLAASGVATAFIGGTTGESSSLTVNERLALGERWMAATKGSTLNVIVHVGANCLADARALAAQAESLKAAGVSALAPSYFKPGSMSTLVDSMAAIASACPSLPFYYYEIPSMTGLSLSPSDFLAAAGEKIPNLAGIKFTSNNLVEYQLCREAAGGRFDIPFGFDEMLLASLALGATSAVGSSYNFAAPIYLRVIDAFKKGDFETARKEQFASVELIRILAKLGYMAAAKATMGMLGVDVGAPRLPNGALKAEQVASLRKELEEWGFFQKLSARA